MGILGGGGLGKKIVQEYLEALKEGKAKKKMEVRISMTSIRKIWSLMRKGSPLKANAYIIIVTRGFSKDKAALEHLIARNFCYGAMVGSGRKINTIREDLISKGRKSSR
jgi:xanthine/CO dehydrogenase XdhC/CoxF family maturation factor